jgi:hypothetical protein
MRHAAMLLKSTVLCFFMAMMCLVSAQDTMQCYVITAQKKRDFMQLKVKKLMNLLTEKLIHTLIPPNVLDGTTINPITSIPSRTLEGIRRDRAFIKP